MHHGLRHAVVAPGSRSAPLALALVRDTRVEVEVVLDERSAAFVALGIGRAARRPALVLCTSGTATTHFHPAVAEAHHAGVPLLVVTADRPPELHGIGAAQTIDQGQLYGDTLRLRCDPGPPEAIAADAWRELAARSYAATVGERPGPVHVNLAFREPLVGGPGTPRGTATQATGVAAEPATEDDAADRGARRADARRAPRRDRRRMGMRRQRRRARPALRRDRLAGARRCDLERAALPGAVQHYEALVRVPGSPTSCGPTCSCASAPRSRRSWLPNGWRRCGPHVMVDPRGLGIDPTRSATTRIECDPELLIDRLISYASFDGHSGRQTTPTAQAWRERWVQLDRRAGAAIGAVLDAVDGASGPQVARDVARSLPDGAQLVVASSMPVRDLEWFGGALVGVIVHANRGVNGIDGTITTATGLAIGSGAPTFVIVGDLAFLHDAGSLLRLAERGVDLTIVVVDNDGGGIFSFLAQREHSEAGEFERLFGTPQRVDLVAVARAYGVDAERVDHAAGFRRALADATTTGRGVRVIVVPVLDRDADVAHHRELWATAARAVSDDGGAAAPPSAAART